MSADIENHKEEEQKEPPKTPIYKRLLGYWQIGFKIVELVSESLQTGITFALLSTSNYNFIIKIFELFFFK